MYQYNDEIDDFEDWLESNSLKLCEEDEEEKKFLETPASIKAKLTNVVGQEEAKRTLCTAIWKKFKYPESKKSNILLVGPSGCGKTFLVENIAKILDVPIVIVDATLYTEVGYIGNDLENIFTQLVAAADGNIAKAEKGIVVIDELDKQCSKPYLTHDSGKGVQHNMLRMLEDGVIKLPDGKCISTDNIMFVACGAFQRVRETLEARQKNYQEKSQKYGMNLVKQSAQQNFQTYLPKNKGTHVNISRDDIMKYGGMIPELIGRFDIVVNLEGLDENVLLQILKNKDQGVMSEYKKLFAKHGYELEVDEEVLVQIAQETMAKGLGARGMRAILDKMLLYPLFDIASQAKKATDTLTPMKLHGYSINNGHFPFIKTKKEVLPRYTI